MHFPAFLLLLLAPALSHRILLADPLSPAAVAVLAASGAHITQRHPTPAELDAGCLADFDAVAVRSATRLSKGALHRGAAGRLRVVARAGVGLDNIDLDAARTALLYVLNTPAASTQSVVELTLALLLASARRIPAADRALQLEGRWLKGELPGHELAGKALGLLGFGRIARGVARLASALGMQVHAFSPSLNLSTCEALGVRHHASAESLFAACTHISVHCGKTESTAGLVDAAMLRRMPHVGADGTQCGAHLVNVARGGVVLEADVAEALCGQVLSSYAADVYETEPLPAASPLLGDLGSDSASSMHGSMPGFIGTPHIGAQTAEASARVGTQLAEAMLEALAGRRPAEGVVCAPEPSA